VVWVTSADARDYVLNIPGEVKRPLREVFPMLTAEGADLVERMLAFDPRQRISVADALAHPYLAQYHDVNEEVIHQQPFHYDLSFEQEEYSTSKVRQLIYEQACEFHP